jgi:hypothetical protein
MWPLGSPLPGTLTGTTIEWGLRPIGAVCESTELSQTTGSGVLALMLLGSIASSGGAQAACGTVVASGLTSPRSIAIADDGRIFVSEAGNGGSEVLPAEQGDEGGPPPTRGLTARVTQIAPGTPRTVTDRLPSYYSEGAEGPAGLVWAAGKLWLAIGGLGDPRKLTPLSHEGGVVSIDPQSGAVTPLARPADYEKTNNPDPYASETNLYGLALGADGNLYVADAGGNTLYRIDPRSGQLSLVAVLPGQPITREQLPPGLIPPDQPLANPDRGNKAEIDPVPTGVAVGPDGSIYVGLLPGFPFPIGGGKVVKVSPSGAVSEAASGLSMVVAIAFGPDNNLYISQLSKRLSFPSDDAPPAVQPGSVVRVLPNGQTQVVADNLTTPNGIAFDRNGNLYVTVNSAVFAPPQAAVGIGQVLRCDGVARPAQAPVPQSAPAQPTAVPGRPPAPAPAPVQLPRGG